MLLISYSMNDQKLDNLLNLALDSTESERLRSGNLNVGFDTSSNTWEVIIKYTENLENVRRIAEEVTELFGGFAILRIKEDALTFLTEIPQVTYVESGKFEFTINGVKKIVSAGDCLYKEPDAVHGCVCLEPGMLIDCFSPMRADFLEKK